MNKTNEKKIARYLKAVEKFNEELAEYIKVTGDNQVPSVDSTCFGYDPIEPYKVTEIPEGFKAESCDMTYEVVVKVDEDYDEEYLDGWDYSRENPYDLLKDAIAYDRRRLKKGLRIFRSENPDAEEEIDDEE